MPVPRNALVAAALLATALAACGDDDGDLPAVETTTTTAINPAEPAGPGGPVDTAPPVEGDDDDATDDTSTDQDAEP